MSVTSTVYHMMSKGFTIPCNKLYQTLMGPCTMSHTQSDLLLDGACDSEGNDNEVESEQSLPCDGNI